MLKDRVHRFASGLARTTEGIAGVLMLGLVIVNALQVFFRYVIGEPLGWTEEFMRYSLVWTVFLASGAALWRGEHMTIDVLGAFLPSRYRRIQYVVVLLCISVFCFILVWKGWPLALRNARQVSPVAGIPMVIPYAAVVVGGALTMLKALAMLLMAPPDVAGKTDAKENAR